MIDPQLLAILACPACEDRPPLRLEDESLVCDVCLRRYPIVNGIPRLLIEDGILPAEAGA